MAWCLDRGTQVLYVLLLSVRLGSGKRFVLRDRKQQEGGQTAKREASQFALSGDQIRENKIDRA
jgi:hypothetical protein